MQSESFIFDRIARKPTKERRAGWIWYGDNRKVSNPYERLRDLKIDIANGEIAFSPEEITEDFIDELAQEYNVKSGKWISKVEEDDVNKQWEKAKGLIGIDIPLTKVSTKLSSKGNYVICFYTPDYFDLGGVYKAGKKIKEGGFDLCGYKIDILTYLSIYPENFGRNLDEFIPLEETKLASEYRYKKPDLKSLEEVKEKCFHL